MLSRFALILSATAFSAALLCTYISIAAAASFPTTWKCSLYGELTTFHSGSEQSVSQHSRVHDHKPYDASLLYTTFIPSFSHANRSRLIAHTSNLGTSGRSQPLVCPAWRSTFCSRSRG